jgi:lysine 2,3-aminomutase
VNQTVLLRGVNDSVECLRELFNGLLRIRVKPYYLFHGDPVQGTMHFRTGVKRGLSLLAALRRQISGLAMPAFALDLPDGRGKVRLEPPCDAGSDDSGIPCYCTEDGTLAVYPDA